MIVVIGSNPSSKSIDKTPFSLSTRSGRTIREWFCDITDVHYVNVSDEPTEYNKPLKSSEINSCLQTLKTKLKNADKIITVGKTADKACCLLNLDHFVMPHPSGRNRILNDHSRIATMVAKLRTWALIREPSNQQS